MGASDGLDGVLGVIAGFSDAEGSKRRVVNGECRLNDES